MRDFSPQPGSGAVQDPGADFNQRPSGPALRSSGCVGVGGMLLAREQL